MPLLESKASEPQKKCEVVSKEDCKTFVWDIELAMTLLEAAAGSHFFFFFLVTFKREFKAQSILLLMQGMEKGGLAVCWRPAACWSFLGCENESVGSRATGVQRS